MPKTVNHSLSFLQVWSGIGVSLIALTLVWLLFQLTTKWITPSQRSFGRYNGRNVEIMKKLSIEREDHVTYILGVLLNQGD